MSEIQADYHVGIKANKVQQIPLNISRCSECGNLLSIWKVNQIAQRDLSIRWRCSRCSSSTSRHYIEFVLR